MDEIISTNSDSETFEEGLKFSRKLKSGDVVFLNGKLGAGKTTFVKGVAEGLNIKSRIISPTFVIVRQHKSANPEIKSLYHIDLYRLQHKDEVVSIYLKDYLNDKNGVVVIEWPNIALHIVDKPTWNIDFTVTSANRREIKISYGKN